MLSTARVARPGIARGEEGGEGAAAGTPGTPWPLVDDIGSLRWVGSETADASEVSLCRIVTDGVDVSSGITGTLPDVARERGAERGAGKSVRSMTSPRRPVSSSCSLHSALSGWPNV